MPTIKVTFGWPDNPRHHSAVFPITAIIDLFCDHNVTEIADNQTGELYKYYRKIGPDRVCCISREIFRVFKELGF